LATQVDYEVLLLWLTLTLFTSIVLALIYRLVVRSIPRGVEAARPVEGGRPAKFLFISADTDIAKELLKRAREDIDEGRLTQAVEKSATAVTDVLSQLLRYFSIDSKGMSIGDIMQSLGRSGVRLPIPHILDRMLIMDGVYGEPDSGCL